MNLQTIPDNETYVLQMRDEVKRLLLNKEVHVFEIGAILSEIKNRLPVGRFSSWVDENLPISRTNSSVYIKVYRRFKCESSQLSHLSLYTLYELSYNDIPLAFIEDVKERHLCPSPHQIHRLKGKEYRSMETPMNINDLAKQIIALQEQVNTMQSGKVRELYALPIEVQEELDRLRESEKEREKEKEKHKIHMARLQQEIDAALEKHEQSLAKQEEVLTKYREILDLVRQMSEHVNSFNGVYIQLLEKVSS